MAKCVITKRADHEHYVEGTGGSLCHYYSWRLLPQGENVGWRWGTIVVTDQEAPLHQHPGETAVVIVKGSGTFRDADGEHAVEEGDMVIVPPLTPHLSIADKGTTMVELIVYFGAEEDVQTMIEERRS